jgi:hypothetical protein
MPSSKTAAAVPRRFPKKTPATASGKSPAELIDARISELADWRGELLSKLRRVIKAADDGVTEEWKWNTPVWSCGGIICTGESYTKAVKLTFAKGASLPDPAHLFNSSLEGSTRRAIDFPDGSVVNETALAELVRAAVALNSTIGKR